MPVYSRSLIEQSRRRVLIFKNGHGSEGVEIVANPEKFEDVSCILKAVLKIYHRKSITFISGQFAHFQNTFLF